MRTVTFFAAGDPVSQGSKRAFVVNGRAVLADVKSDRLKKWRKVVETAAREVAPAELIDAPVEVRLAFDVTRPASVKREYPAVAPDIDKLARAVLDALTGTILRDDSRVVRLVATKVYGPQPGVRVTVGVLVDTTEGNQP